MVELLGILATSSRWHFLLLVCVVDVTFLVMTSNLISNPEGHEGHEDKLKKVIDMQASVRAGLQENRLALQQLVTESRLRRHQTRKGESQQRNRTLDMLHRGVSQLEGHIRRLGGEIREIPLPAG